MSDSDEDVFEALPALMRAKNAKDGASIVKSRKDHKRTTGLVGGGSFQSLGLPPEVLKMLLRKGFTRPTPIQRKALPSIMNESVTTEAASIKKVTVGRDHVCMARTGSGKTLCYLVPILARLQAHSPSFGVRSLILVPTRELALQVLRMSKELTRGEAGSDLRFAVLVGGESLEDQFTTIMGNPDVVIATPGRLMHLVVEMSLDLKSVEMLVFDEADRLFELGFEQQLHELIHRLPVTRQTLLFSATLPASVIAFSKAGLESARLIRLDSETKVSPDLQMSFFAVNEPDKVSLLLYLLSRVIKVPPVEYVDPAQAAARKSKNDKSKNDKRTKKKAAAAPDGPRPKQNFSNQTAIFVPTKHHVEFLSSILEAESYAVSPIYGSMDQTARKMWISRFRNGYTQILLVTDLAARGLDVPTLDNVVNYGLTDEPKKFVHRVGRTARAGRRGSAFSFVSPNDMPYLMDLKTFLGLALITPADDADEHSLILGSVPRSILDLGIDSVRIVIDHDATLSNMELVVERAQAKYERSRNKASPHAYTAAKDWRAHTASLGDPIHPLLTGDAQDTVNESTAQMLAKVNAFRPHETVFEIGARSKDRDTVQIMKARRRALTKSRDSRALRATALESDGATEPDTPDEDAHDQDEASSSSSPADIISKFADKRFYMPYDQAGKTQEEGYSIDQGDFAAQAASAQFDLSTGAGDSEHDGVHQQKASALKWDRKTKRFVRGDKNADGEVRMIKSESGQRIPASFRSGAFDKWQAKARVRLPRVGEQEPTNAAALARSKGGPQGRPQGKSAKGKPQTSAGAAGLKDAAQIRKDRIVKERNRIRSNQPSKKRRVK